MIGVFTHIILTAPSQSIADVYNQQLSLFKSSSDSGVLISCELLVCIPDPWGLRVGSGGGTLNVLRQLRDRYGLQVGDKHCKILIIHSGGDSQRAPLYSLCGKAWMSINSIIGGSREIASALSLLIQEISLFCSKLTGESLVVASSDVMLDITTGSKDIEGLVFAPNCVTVVAVPESIHVAKNHGVLVSSSSKTDGLNPVIYEHASHYLQKPSIDRMIEVDACLQETEDQPNAIQYTLVDTGIVIFHGLALSRLFDLTTHAVIERCTLHGQWKGDSHSVTDGVLRIELYSDILHALELREQETCCIEEYLRRLGLPADFCSHLDQQVVDTAAATLYKHALLALWETLRTTKLYLLYIRAGKFDHLGTTREALSLLSMGRSITTSSSTSSTSSSSSSSSSSDQCEGGAVEQSRGRLTKQALFAAKYRLQSEVLSCMQWEGDGAAVFPGVAINSRLRYRPHALSSNSPLRASEHDRGKKLLSVTEHSEGAMKVLVEHSLLSGSMRLPSTGIVSHVGASVGRDLQVEEGSMMQQVFMKPSADLLHTAVVATGGEPIFALIVLNIRDDIKGLYPNSSICSSDWDTFFRLSASQCSDIWTSGSTADRTIWNAKLFPLSKTDDRGNIHVYCDASMEWISSSKLSLTWMQSLPHHRDNSIVDDSYLLAIYHWRLAKRVSLSDILRHGDAAAMFEWRTWLQLDDRHLSASDADEVDQLRDLSATFEWMLRYYTLFRGYRLDHVDVHVCMLSQWLLVLCGGLVQRDITNPDMDILWRSLINDKAVVSDESMRCIVMDLNQLFDFMCTSSTSAVALSQRVALHLRSFIFDRTQLSMVLTALLRCHDLIPQEYLSRILFQSAWLVGNHKDVVVDVALMTKQMTMDRCVDEMMMSLASGPSAFQAAPLFRTIADFTLSALAASNDMRRVVDQSSGVVVIDLSCVLESLAQKIIAYQIQRSLVHHIGIVDHCPNQQPHPPTLHRSMVSVARSPVRIDLSGGWSDTPPICYEKAGAVLNVAVRVDEQYPIRCASRWIDKPVLSLHSMLRADTDGGDSIDGSSAFTTETCECIDVADVASFPHAVDQWKCALLKAVVVALKVIDVNNSNSRDSSLSYQLMTRYGGGLELQCVSDLPAGSGMGGSSVLAATILKSLSQLLGMECTPRELIYLVSQVEQLLTTGGGWQDQVGCIYGDFKIGRSLASLPLTVSVEAIPTSPVFIDQLQKRMCLVYTGQQRLAKHTLINALRYNAFTSPSNSTAAPSDDTVSRLIRGAEDGFKLLSALDCDNVDSTVDGLAACINEYWGLKKRMAAGSEPVHIQRLFSLLSPHCVGLSLCGAGAGGYAVVILKDEDSVSNVAAVLDGINQSIVGEVDRLLSLHRVTVDAVGLHAQLHSRHEYESLRGYILL